MRENSLFVKALDILPVIVEIEGILKRIRDQKLGDQNISH